MINKFSTNLRSITSLAFNKAKPYSVLAATIGLLININGAAAQTGNPRVNQLGYLPNSIKIATFKGSVGNQQWQLKQNGTLVASGQTSAATLDASSGDYLQQIDLTSVTATGSGFTLTVGGETSYPFKITSSVYSGALYDSLRYFYHNRAGIAINTQYTGGGNGSYAADAKWSRAAGHINVGANKGDYNTPCWAGLSCAYTLSPVKGWYDAGDHGKYVVNGGISAWTLLNMYERNQHLIPLSRNLDDGKLNIPESANGISDLLDEARWEVEFLLAMQVPVNQPKAGMAHHKLHDVGWTGIPTLPSQDTMQRALVQPTTAATLNLAAVAAQCARIWKNIDSGFSSSCLTAATRAWDAAVANPNLYYDASTYNTDNGGGGYGDNTVTDEFYWAAAELYITTGDAKYLPTINNYNLAASDWSWGATEMAGVVSLATVSAPQTTSLQASAKQRVITSANTHLATQNNSAYSSPLAPVAADFDWGSNSTVMNRLILMGLAYDFTMDAKYAAGVTKGLDYLFGRNYFSTSYVTGEGTKTMTQPHHRVWANAANASFPTPPPGAISGGPNAASLVGTAEGGPAGCASKPATCWRDAYGAYGVNEITINWNSPLAWVLNWQKDYGDGTSHAAASSTASSTPSSTATSSAPSSTGVSTLSVTIEAESYASMSGVQTETTTDVGGGLNVGYIDAGDTMSYTNTAVSVPSTGSYIVTYRVASMSGGGSLSLLEAGSSTSYDTSTIPSTGGWQNWTDVQKTVTLTAGTHYFSLKANAGGFNINRFKIVSATTTSSAASSVASSAPSSVASSAANTTPLVTIQAEAYSQMSGVQTETTSDTGGGLNVGYIDAGDWLSYSGTSVVIPTTGTYTIAFRVASMNGGGSLIFQEAGGSANYATVAIASTGGWQTWKTIKTTVTLTAGTHHFGFNAAAGGWNFNWFSITQGVN